MTIQSAEPLLAFIRKTETGREGAAAYDTMYAHKSITPKLTDLTLDQAIAAGPTWTRNHKSSAAGAYQFMNATLKDLKASLMLSGTERMTPAFQDRLGYALLQRRGFEQFMSGKLSTISFGLALAKEWASFPVLADTMGAHRKAKRGQSYYVGDALNKSLITPEQVETVLAQLRTYDAPKAPPAAPVDVTPRDDLPVRAAEAKGLGWLIGAIVVIAFIVWFVFIRR